MISHSSHHAIKDEREERLLFERRAWVGFIIIVFLVIKSQTKRPQTGNEGLIKMCGEASTDIFETGKVFVHGEYWNAKSSSPVNKGDKIRVVKVDGMLLTIEKR